MEELLNSLAIMTNECGKLAQEHPDKAIITLGNLAKIHLEIDHLCKDFLLVTLALEDN